MKELGIDPNKSPIGFIRDLVMSTDAGSRKFEAEKAAIDEAYADHIKKLFEVYSIGDAMENDREALAKFKRNVEALRQAHVRALSVFSDHDA